MGERTATAAVAETADEQHIINSNEKTELLKETTDSSQPVITDLGRQRDQNFMVEGRTASILSKSLLRVEIFYLESMIPISFRFFSIFRAGMKHGRPLSRIQLFK